MSPICRPFLRRQAQTKPRVQSESDTGSAGTSRTPPTSRYAGQFRPEYSRLYRDPDLLWVNPIGVRYIVGIVGFRGAGKSSVASYLAEKHGFESFTLSGIVREEAERRGVPMARRDLLQDIGDELRAEHHHPAESGCGDGAYLSRVLLRRIHAQHQTHHVAVRTSRVVISGFKHPDEVTLMAHTGLFRTLLLSAPDTIRADRALRTGLLARELTSLGVSYSNPPEGGRGKEAVEELARYQAEMRGLFFDHLDARDRDGRQANPWAGDLAQAVERTVAAANDKVRQESAERDEGSRQPRTVFEIANEQEFSDDVQSLGGSLFAKVDAMIEQLEREFRSTTRM